MYEINTEKSEVISGGVEIPLPSLGDALAFIAKGIYDAIR